MFTAIKNTIIYIKLAMMLSKTFYMLSSRFLNNKDCNNDYIGSFQSPNFRFIIFVPKNRRWNVAIGIRRSSIEALQIEGKFNVPIRIER
jgi:hypothetical protein